jgi:leader peptidase (prepilin peptidase) / N-methyltransferase
MSALSTLGVMHMNASGLSVRGVVGVPGGSGVPRLLGVVGPMAPSISGLLLGALVGLLLAPLVSVLTSRPPLLDATELPGVPFRCDSCRAGLSLMESLPLLSFLALRGKCRHCQAPINRWDLGAETLSIVLCAFVGWRVGIRWDLPAHLLVAAMGATVILVDARLHKIATRLVYPAAAVLGVLLGAAVVADGSGGFGFGDLGRALLCGFAAFAFIWILGIISPAGMGDGDARLVLSLGMLLGWHSYRLSYLGLLMGFILGSVFGVLLMLIKRGSRKTQIAFGPYLVAGALFVAAWPSAFGSILVR